MIESGVKRGLGFIYLTWIILDMWSRVSGEGA